MTVTFWENSELGYTNSFYELHEKQSDLKAFLKIVWTWSIGQCGDKSTVAQLLDMLVFCHLKLDLQKIVGANTHSSCYVGIDFFPISAKIWG